MKPFLIAAALMLAPAAAQAQVAAGAMPNTFDRPAQAAPVRPAPAPAATPAPAPALSTTPANAASEGALRAFIAGGQAGTIDYSAMTENLGAQMRQQEATILPLFQQFGALQAVDFVGSQEEFDLFAVVFANAATQWVVSLTDDGKISALQFRPAE
jgi:hypothetical protein